ncbi:hypothetical protein IP80_19930 [beta proteobacterium AAP65]|nr:hypothetical protein IP80_19930 [beta proteobacterium AAP65]
MWSLVRPGAAPKSRRDIPHDAITQIPTIGVKTAGKLLDTFGEDMLGGMLEDSVFEFINLMDEKGALFFTDRQARRMERAMAHMEFSFGQGTAQSAVWLLDPQPVRAIRALFKCEGPVIARWLKPELTLVICRMGDRSRHRSPSADATAYAVPGTRRDRPSTSSVSLRAS